MLAAEPGAQVGLGLKPGVTKSGFAQAIKNGSAEQCLDWIDVHAGELIYVPAGTVHAIGPGSILVETQQNSDTTFRLYDYGRPRELHLEQGLNAMKELTRAGKCKPLQPREIKTSEYMSNPAMKGLLMSRHFRLTLLTLGGKEDGPISGANHGNSDGADPWRCVEVLVCLKGKGMVEMDQCAPVTFSTGQAVVVPAAANIFWLRSAVDDLEVLSILTSPTEATWEPNIV